jgi:hypothetical protein
MLNQFSRTELLIGKEGMEKLKNSRVAVFGNYWTMVHGNTPDEVHKDEEGLQIMRTLGNNMTWLLKCIEAGKNAGINAPETEEKIKTNFIR